MLRSKNDSVHSSNNLLPMKSKESMGDAIANSNNKLQQEVLIDSSLVVDIFFDRPSPLTDDVSSLFNLIEKRKVKGYITDIGLAEIGLYIKNYAGEEKSKIIESKIKEFLGVYCVKKNIISGALKSTVVNFHNAIYLECLSEHGFDAVVTATPDCLQGSNSIEFNQSKVVTPIKYLRNYYQINELLSDIQLEETYIEVEEYSRTGERIDLIEDNRKPTQQPIANRLNSQLQTQN